MKNLATICETIRSNFDTLRQRYRVKNLSIFGSYAREEPAENSDVDIMVEYDCPISLLELVDTELFLCDLLGKRVDLVLKRSIRPEIRDSVLKEAVSV